MKPTAIKLTLTALTTLIAFVASAQMLQHDSLAQVDIKAKTAELPNIQQISLHAPDNIKIDGKATEWKRFQAYNKTTNIYYSIANDDKNLYLVIQTPDPALINKILGGGVTFSINRFGQKNMKEAASITYPALTRDNRMHINFDPNDGKIVPGVTTPYMKGDSFVMVNNQRLADKSKFIRVTGIPGLDTLTSIYNRDGVKAAALFDNKMTYTYELAIDLKKLGLSTTNPEKFTYNIKLNSITGPISEFLADKNMPPGFQLMMGSSTYIPPANPVHTPGNPHGYLLMIPTDFWGEYTLAR